MELSTRAAARIQHLKEESLQAKQYICVQRARYLTEAYARNEADPMILRRAKAFAHVLENMDVFLEDGQLLAGAQAGSLRAGSLFPEYCCQWLFDEIDQFEHRPGDRFYVRPEDREEILRIAGWWKGRTVEDRCMAVLPQEVKDAYTMSVMSASGNMTSGDGHIMLDFEKILHTGAQGIIDEAKAHLAQLDVPRVPSDYKKVIFYQSVIVAYEGMITYADRCADLAARLAAETEDRGRKQELLRLSEVCRRVPRYPAETFYEGVQSVWFAHLLSQIESNGHSMSFGRLDQYMFPYYQKDLAAGRIDAEGAVELLACLWLKAFGIVKIRPWSHTRFSGGGPTYQNLTLGGITPDGKDAVNELTMLCLDSVAQTRLPQPNVSARYNRLNPDAYLNKCLEVVKLGFGMPALHGDQMMIPSLVSRGVSQEDANNYAIVGCIEPIVPGKFGYRSAGMSFTNFAKILEIALAGGTDPRTGLKLLDLPKDLTACGSFEELMESYRAALSKVVELRVTGEAYIDYSIEELVPEAFCSGLIHDCMGRGKTAKEGGSIYDMVTGPETGIVNTANSLMAIKELVFRRHALTTQQLRDVLASNFEGVDGERIRQMLINSAPKFGNDNDEVDSLADQVYRMFIEQQAKYPTARVGRGPIGCLSYPCTATISGNVPSGVNVGASAEGRFAGEPLTEGCSPYHGTDKKGPTAVLSSVAKMPNDLITGGNLLNLKFAPEVFSHTDGREKMRGMIQAFFAMNGWHVQFNIVSTDTLRKAQIHPDEYKDLVVRVAGYSALFNDLEPETQNDIIERTEHEL